jgi:clan AA aspartic protease
MMLGKVKGRTAVIEIGVAGRDDEERLEATIDTGYNGYLTLPEHVIAGHRLSFAGYRRGILADGSVVVLAVYLATITWHGLRKEALVSQAEGTPLIGMALLHGSRLVIDVIDGGAVTIDKLPPSTHDR